MLEFEARDEIDARVFDIHSELYPFVHYIKRGSSWCIESPDYDEAFDTYDGLLEFVREEVKESLLYYALNGELEEVAEAIR